jgi:hypothetical protein
MKIRINNNCLIVKKSFFETSVFFLLPSLLLPLVSDSHYRYIDLYLLLAMLYIWLYVKEMEHPVLFLKNDALSFRKFGKFSYMKGFLTYEGMSYKPTTLLLKDISKIEFDYPMISVFQTSGEQFKIALKTNEKCFNLVKGMLAKAHSIAV